MRSYSITMKSTKIGIPLIILKPSTGGGVFCYILQHNENETWFEGYVDDRFRSLPPVNGREAQELFPNIVLGILH